MEEHWVFMGAVLCLTVFQMVEQRMARAWVSWSYEHGLPIFRRSIKLTSPGGATYDMRGMIEQDEVLRSMGVETRSGGPDEYMVYIPMTNGWLERRFKSSVLRGDLRVNRAFSELRFAVRLSLPSAISIAALPLLVVWNTGGLSLDSGSPLFFVLVFSATFAFQYYRLRKRLKNVTRRLEALMGGEGTATPLPPLSA